MNELTINGFSALTEEEMMMVDGGGIWAFVCACAGTVIGGISGGIVGLVAGATAGYIIGMGADGEPIFKA